MSMWAIELSAGCRNGDLSIDANVNRCWFENRTATRMRVRFDAFDCARVQRSKSKSKLPLKERARMREFDSITKLPDFGFGWHSAHDPVASLVNVMRKRESVAKKESPNARNWTKRRIRCFEKWPTWETLSSKVIGTCSTFAWWPVSLFVEHDDENGRRRNSDTRTFSASSGRTKKKKIEMIQLKVKLPLDFETKRLRTNSEIVTS